MRSPVNIGDRVAFTREFLQSCAIYTGWAPQARGRVISLLKLHSDRDSILVTVKWDGVETPSRHNIRNLIREDLIPLES